MKNKLILFIVAGLLLWGTSAFAGLAFLGGGHRLVASGTFTLANSRMSLVDGTAFFWVNGLDLSAYAGLDSGSHEYLIKVYDDDGYSIQGYVGAVGGGEEYTDIIGGTNPALLNGDFSLGDTVWTKKGSAAITGGAGVYTTGTDTFYQQAIITINSIGILYRMTGTAVYSSGSGKLKYPAGNWITGIFGVDVEFTTAGGTGDWIKYAVAVNTRPDFEITNVSWYGTIDDLGFQQVTDCAATGFHIISAQGGSTQNWQNVGASFNYNDTAYSYKIYKVR